MKYLRNYDNLLKFHLKKYSNKWRGNANYLSHNICDEFIGLIQLDYVWRVTWKVVSLFFVVSFLIWYSVSQFVTFTLKLFYFTILINKNLHFK